MSSSLPQSTSPPMVSSSSHSSPGHEKVTNDINRAIPQPERPTKVERLSSSSSGISGTQEIVHHSNGELCASFSGLLLPSSSSFAPLSITLSQNERTQAPPTLEYVASVLRTQRLAEDKQAVYIPPLAKPSLLAPDETSFPLMERVEEFLTGDGQVMLVLGDSGAGKSTFNRHLELRLWQDYKADGPIPLLVNLPALDRPEKDLVVEHLRRLDFSEELIWDMKRARQFVLICDGYDESQLTCNLHTTNLLNQSGQWSAKLVITCRTQYLGQNYRDRFEPQGGSHYDLSAPDLFRESVIAPFTKGQIEEYVAQYVPLEPRTWTREDYMDRLTTIPGLIGLVKNPFLLSLALGALPAVVEGKDDLSRVRVNRVQLYDSFVQHWLRANKRRLRNQNLKLSRDEQRMIDELLDDGFEESGVKFQADLAAAIFQEQEGKPVVEYNHRRDKSSWKRAFFNTDLDTCILRDASLLVRSGNMYRFVHRSILEYFCSCTVCPPPAIDNEFAPQGSTEPTSAQPFIVDHPLSRRSLVTEQSIVQFLAERAQANPEFKRQLYALLKQSKTDERASQAAANAITILVRAGVRFNGADLRGIRIPGADLSGGQFDSAQLQEADLTGAILIKCWIRQVDFTNARLDGVQFGELPHLEEDHWVHTCAYSPDGNTFAVGLNNGDICIYNTATWTRTRKLQGHERGVFSLAFSPSGHQLLSGSYGTTVQVWNIETGLSDFVFQGQAHTTWTRIVAFSPCGNQIASAIGHNSVRLWDARTGAVVFDLTTGPVSGVSYSPDGERMATGGKDGSIRIFDTQTGLLIVQLDSRCTGIRCITYSPDGQRIITGHGTGELQLWSMSTNEPGPRWTGHTDGTTVVDFSPNGKWIASSSFDCTVKLWDTQTQTLVSMFTGHSEAVYSVVFSPDGLQVASGSWDRTVRLWEVTASGTGLDSRGSFESASCVAFSPDGRHLVSGNKDGYVRQYNTDTGEQDVILSCGPQSANCVAYSPDGLYIATNRDIDLTLWEASTGLLVLVFCGHEDIINTVAFSPCGYWIATGSNDMTVVLWDMESGELSRVFIGHSHGVNSVSFSPAGRHLVSGSQEAVRVWDLSMGESRALVTDGQYKDVMVAYSPTGSQIATNATSIHLWLQDEKTGAIKHILEHGSVVNRFAFSSCGQWIATCYDNWVWLWNCDSDSEGVSQEWTSKALIRGLVRTAVCVAWRPGTLDLVTGSVDGSICVWRLTEPELGVVQLLWGLGPVALVTTNAAFEGAVGLSAVNLMLLRQRFRFETLPR
ncbi:hypothetical protein BGX30_012670 [Mortierella sp. GBA39]|nr:hypothetical protein BGX30_012670 [Mortierella sp. GBA39]